MARLPGRVQLRLDRTHENHSNPRQPSPLQHSIPFKAPRRLSVLSGVAQRTKDGHPSKHAHPGPTNPSLHPGMSSPLRLVRRAAPALQPGTFKIKPARHHARIPPPTKVGRYDVRPYPFLKFNNFLLHPLRSGAVVNTTAFRAGLKLSRLPHFHKPFAGRSDVDPIKLSAQLVMKVGTIQGQENGGALG